MTTIHMTICDICNQTIDIGKKYFIIFERIKGKYPHKMSISLCEECYKTQQNEN